MTSRLRPPTLKEVKNLAFTVGIGLLIAFFIWYSSYFGWFLSAHPSAAFSMQMTEHSKALTWEQLKTQNPNMLPPEPLVSTQVHFNISRQYWDKVIYPKNVFIFHVEVKNLASQTLWYPSQAVFIIDSSNYVRGKYFFQLLGDDSGVKAESSNDFIFYFAVPPDMSGQTFFVRTILFGKIAYSYPALSELMSTREDAVYGELPSDWGRGWFISQTETMFTAYPSLVSYLLQVGSIATNSIFIIALAFLTWISEKIRLSLGTQYGFYLVVGIFMVIFFLAVFLLGSFLAH